MGSLRDNFEMTIGPIIRKVIKPQCGVYKNLQVLYRSFLALIKTRKLKMLKFGVMLADHCNLNCADCGAYSPLAEERFYDIDVFRNECERIAYLTDGKIDTLVFAGGEPLLHPWITEFFDTARSFFVRHGGAYGRISILSNGILLPKQDVGFWENCKKNDIRLV
jgi:molybdenum cofactor biosynthesis enzyme MoaA